MRKVISLLLILCFCVGLCSCGTTFFDRDDEPSKSDVKKAIRSITWYGSLTIDGVYREYTVNFANDGSAHIYRDIVMGSRHITEWDGTYEIEDDQIIISAQGTDFYVEYTFEDDEISLTLYDGDIAVPLHKPTNNN